MRISFATLLLALVALLLIVPALAKSGHGQLAVAIAFPLLLIAGAFAASERRRTRAWAIFLLVPSLASDVLVFLTWTPVLVVVSRALDLVFLGFVTLVMVAHVTRARSVTLDTVLGGVCVYLLIGVFFFRVFSILEFAVPGSFLDASASISPSESQGSHIDLIYFSFVTLTTLGYGDITPEGPIAQALAAAEAIVGQLYLTILIAWLVGMHLSQTRSGER